MKKRMSNINLKDEKSHIAINLHLKHNNDSHQFLWVDIKVLHNELNDFKRLFVE